MISFEAILVAVTILGIAWVVMSMWRHLKDWGVDETSEGLLLCRSCGYDLRANVDRCPECGITIPVPEDYDEILARFPRLNRPPTQRIEPRSQGADEEPVIVAEIDSYRVALLLAEQLTARGIASWSEPQPVHGVKLDPAEPAVVLVWSGDLEHARTLVDLLLQPRPMIAEAAMS